MPTVTVSMALYIDSFTLADGVYILYPGFRAEDSCQPPCCSRHLHCEQGHRL